MLSAAVFIARADLAFMLRQKETLLWIFVMPLLFFYFGAAAMAMPCGVLVLLMALDMSPAGAYVPMTPGS